MTAAVIMLAPIVLTAYQDAVTELKKLQGRWVRAGGVELVIKGDALALHKDGKEEFGGARIERLEQIMQGFGAETVRFGDSADPHLRNYASGLVLTLVHLRSAQAALTIYRRMPK